jgi:hypothetical protein
MVETYINASVHYLSFKISRVVEYVHVRYNAKYHFSFWRQVTAIQNGAIDGNSATVPDPLWLYPN